jgi:hypothetical protein
VYKQLVDDVTHDYKKFGGGLLSPDNKTFYVNIPKNASSFINSWLAENNWKVFDYSDNNTLASPIENIAVVLRDPTTRFISGFAQYLPNIIYTPWNKNNTSLTITELTSYWPIIERFMLEHAPWFDDHTWPQYYFYRTILPEVPRLYFNCNSRLEETLKYYFNLNEPSKAVRDNANITANNRPLMKQMQDLIRQTLSNQNNLSKLNTQYKHDHDIINSVKYIRAPR